MVICQNSTENEIKKTIELFFEGIQKGDTLAVNKAVHHNFRGLTTYINKEGNSVIADEVTKKQFLSVVASKNPNDVWFEKILSYTIEIDTNLANVWTPYEFYVNGTFIHCGSNSFQLVLLNEQWIIVSIIDTRRRENCR
jgi:hypothetical protein